jgi:hypothetical protein
MTDPSPRKRTIAIAAAVGVAGLLTGGLAATALSSASADSTGNGNGTGFGQHGTMTQNGSPNGGLQRSPAGEGAPPGQGAGSAAS